MGPRRLSGGVHAFVTTSAILNSGLTQFESLQTGRVLGFSPRVNPTKLDYGPIEILEK